MKKNVISRRDYLRLLGLSGGAALLAACTTDDLGKPSIGSKSLPGVSETLSDVPDLEIALRAIEGETQILSGKATRVWQYQGEVLSGSPDALKSVPNSYLGPIFKVTKGQTIRVHFTNELPEESIIHWHGLHVPVEADGHPRLAIKPGETYIYNFKVLDRAGTYWYHPHPHGRTGPQAYYGLAGLFIISDEDESSLDLPCGEFDVPIVIQDRLFDGGNQLVYGGNSMMNQMTGFLGNRVLVNGQPDFIMPVATRPYRLRLHNGSNSRIYKLAWEDGTPMTVIATDGGLLEKPLQKNAITLAPAQRIEIWVDFSGREVGERLRLVSLPSAAPDGRLAFPILTIQIDRSVTVSAPLPAQLSRLGLRDEAQAVNRRSPRDFDLSMGMGMGWTINSRTFEMNDVARDEVVQLGDLEVWQFTNQVGGAMGGMGGGMGGMGGGMGGMGSGMRLPHPMHIHGLQFQILKREITSGGRADWATLSDGFVDEGWHDTVLVMPGERVRVLLKFEDFTGLYLYHCHNLEHEDMGMMRNYRVEA
jgi:blue copper oxidase